MRYQEERIQYGDNGSMGASVGGGGAFTYSQSAGPTSYVYHVFVHKKNMDRAKELINWREDDVGAFKNPIFHTFE